MTCSELSSELLKTPDAAVLLDVAGTRLCITGVDPLFPPTKQYPSEDAVTLVAFVPGSSEEHNAAANVPLPKTTDDLLAGLTDGIDACQHWPASRFVPATAVTVMKALADVLAKPENAAVAQDVVDTANRPGA